MLKIKDSVDLKELEKFGFKNIEVDSFSGSFEIYDNYYLKVMGDNCPQTTEYLVKNQFPRRLFIGQHNNCAYDRLYDLIKADLVEKV